MTESDKGSLLPPFLSGDPHWESDVIRTIVQGDKRSLLPPFLSGDPHLESDGARTMIEGDKGSLLPPFLSGGSPLGIGWGTDHDWRRQGVPPPTVSQWGSPLGIGWVTNVKLDDLVWWHGLVLNLEELLIAQLFDLVLLFSILSWFLGSIIPSTSCDSWSYFALIVP